MPHNPGYGLPDHPQNEDNWRRICGEFLGVAVDNRRVRETSRPYLDGGRHDSPLYPGVVPPVEPNPPLPRVVSPSWVAFATVRLTRETGATTNWAMRMPRVAAKGSAPWFTSRTRISPR